MSTAFDPQAERTVGRYQLGVQLAAGGMGTIHRAFDSFLGRDVAYKRLRVDREATRAPMTALFRREYDTLVALSHPSTVEAYDYGFDELGPYYTMELISGQDLTQVAPLPWRVACRVMRDIASALALLHARRLLHRDVSPNNVRLTLDGVSKLLDYGALSPFGLPKEIVGTPPFMAPESLSGVALDQRSDLFSLGALLYWTLTQRTCFRATRIDDLPTAWAKPVKAPSTLVPEIPPELDELVLSLLEIDIAARPHSAAYVIERLTTLAQLEPEANEHELALGYLRRPPLVERESTVELLRTALRDAISGSGQTILLEASAGLGRSALLERLTLDAQLAGTTVLRADGGGQASPYELVKQLVKIGVQTFPEPANAQSDSLHTQRIHLPTQRVERARSAIEAIERRSRVAARLREQLINFSARRPLLVLVDDAQSADADSLALLASLVDELPRHPILLVLSVRAGAEALPPQVRDKLERKARLATLSQLSEDAMVELVSTALGDVPHSRRLALLLHRESGGVPGVAVDLLRLLIQRGEISYTLGTFTVPTDVALRGQERSDDTLLARIHGMSETALTLLALLSLHRGALSLEQLALACGLSTRDVALALELAEQRSVVVESSGSYFLASELLRAALVRQLAPAQAEKHHAAIARSILATSEGNLELHLPAGYHQLRSGAANELAGAMLIADACRELRFEAPMFGGATGLLSEALTVYLRHGLSEEECLDLRVPLVIAGFYGNLAAQRANQEPAFATLAKRCGLTVAARLTPYVGATLAIYLGLFWGFLRGLFVRTRVRRTLAIDLENLFAASGSAVAAFACVFSVKEAQGATDRLVAFAPLPANTAGAVSREFCVATAELCAMQLHSAIARYDRLLAILEKPVLGMEALFKQNFYDGCVHGKAQGVAEDDEGAQALELADQLERTSTFFAPHAETVRVGYYGARGDAENLAIHRTKAENLALLGGVSWSSTTVLTIRCLYASALTGDALGLVRVVADLERLRELSDTLRLYHELAQAHLDHTRGQHDRAIVTYERVLGSDQGKQLTTYRLDCTLFALALRARGEPQRARELCLEALATAAPDTARGHRSMRYLVQNLALAEAELGAHERAAALLAELLSELASSTNPATVGTLHRDCAQAAVLAGDEAAFIRHVRVAERELRATRNPSLIVQLEKLFTQAERAGFAGRSVEPSLAFRDSLDDLGSTVIEQGTAPQPGPGDPVQTRLNRLKTTAVESAPSLEQTDADAAAEDEEQTVRSA